MANTLTSTQVARVVTGVDRPPAVPGVMNAVHVSFTAGGTSVSTGDIIQFAAVPDRARIVDMVFTMESGNVDSAIVSIGDGSLGTRWISSASLSATTGVWMQKAQSGHGYKVSLTASVEQVGFETIDVTMTSLSPCVTASLQLSVYYLYEPGS